VQQQFACDLFSQLADLILHPPSVVRYHLTGFGEFNGVKSNPTGRWSSITIFMHYHYYLHTVLIADLMQYLPEMANHPHVIERLYLFTHRLCFFSYCILLVYIATVY
jgi:hypothetical protein